MGSRLVRITAINVIIPGLKRVIRRRHNPLGSSCFDLYITSFCDKQDIGQDPRKHGLSQGATLEHSPEAITAVAVVYVYITIPFPVS